MGQRPSRPKLSLTWVLRGERPTTKLPASPPPRTLSEPTLLIPKDSLTTATPRSSRSSRERHRHRRHRPARHKSERQRRCARIGYEIHDVDIYLTKASLEKPANIPVVLGSSCVLYQTRLGGYQQEFSLPLGTVVNAIFKNDTWLYVQTPHGQEGYVRACACLPLGILPPPHSRSRPTPCWETHTDIFPRPVGGGSSRCRRKARSDRLERDAVSACGERSVDRLYLRAAASAKGTRHTLLVISADYCSKGRNTLTVNKGDVVALVSGHLKDWFWVRRTDGSEGFIPSVIAGHGFL